MNDLNQAVAVRSAALMLICRSFGMRLCVPFAHNPSSLHERRRQRYIMDMARPRMQRRMSSSKICGQMLRDPLRWQRVRAHQVYDGPSGDYPPKV